MDRRSDPAAGHPDIGGTGCRLLQRVLEVDGPDDAQALLGGMGEELRAAGVPLVGCGLYAFEPGKPDPVVRFHPLRPQSEWHPVGADESRAVLQAWETGTTGKRAIIGPSASGFLTRSLSLPFSHGLLVLELPADLDAGDPRLGPAGEVAHILDVLFRRLEDRRQLASLESQVCQVQGLAAVGRLAAEAAHEINNPLSALLGECSLLLEMELEPAVREGVAAAYRAAMQARTVSSRLLGLARTQAAEREPVDLNGLVRDVLCLLRRQLGRQEIELVEELEAGLPAVLGHASQLQQVILNLVQNSQEAIRSSRRTGRIWVRTRGQGGQVVLEVEDDGPGVPAPIRDRVFEPFFTTKSGAQGTGLGLSVCQQIARSHGGQLRLAPRAWGACMVVELPGVDGVSLARAAAAPRVARSSA